MPLIKIRTSPLIIKDEKKLLKNFSEEMARLSGKSESYIMVILEAQAPMIFVGTDEPCCFIEVKSIGALKPNDMTKCFCDIISKFTEIPKNRIYVAFEDVNASLWGFNGSTFG